MPRAAYAASVAGFLAAPPEPILGALARSQREVTPEQAAAWSEQIAILRRELLLAGPAVAAGQLLLEFTIPRFGRRIDAVVLAGPLVFVLEFKAGADPFAAANFDQVWDYALDLKSFHEPSHALRIAPVLVAASLPKASLPTLAAPAPDGVLPPLACAAGDLARLLLAVLAASGGEAPADFRAWENGRYLPSPTIVEAAVALFRDHRVADLTRHDAGAQNLALTTGRVAAVIAGARARGRKAICFVTGVPGAGKTLVGLDIAAKHNAREDTLRSVYLSGNQPLVSVLREALARDRAAREGLRKGDARRAAGTLIQIVHRFRDECLKAPDLPPQERVALFDEAQRAWTKEQLASFMQRKKGVAGFAQSEPEYLISCLDRHRDWAAIVCLVGGGQEINTGEAGIQAWVEPLCRRFREWEVHISPRLEDAEYGAGAVIGQLAGRPDVFWSEDLHLGVSMRSFRAESVALLVKQLLDRDAAGARQTLGAVLGRYPIVLTRSLAAARRWLRHRARGSERYGLVASSSAERLRPHALDVRAPMDPVHWFLDPKQDVRSSYYLELPATEFQIQGLELDWSCVTWDADFRYGGDGWRHFDFQGRQWKRVKKAERRQFLKNAYRVLLTRARQGMVICVPEGDPADPTRERGFYDPTFEYLRAVGIPLLAEPAAAATGGGSELP